MINGARGPFEQHLLHPLPALAEQVAVVADEDHHGVLCEPEAIEGVEQAADVGVEEADRRVVRLNRGPHTASLTSQFGGVVNQAGGGTLSTSAGDHFGAWLCDRADTCRKHLRGAMKGQCGR